MCYNNEWKKSLDLRTHSTIRISLSLSGSFIAPNWITKLTTKTTTTTLLAAKSTSPLSLRVLHNDLISRWHIDPVFGGWRATPANCLLRPDGVNLHACAPVVLTEHNRGWGKSRTTLALFSPPSKRKFNRRSHVKKRSHNRPVILRERSVNRHRASDWQF